jgi:hypothetical protein
MTEDPRRFDGYAQVAENERRAALQPLELAALIAKRIALGESRKEVACKLGMHPSAVIYLLCLSGDVPQFLMELYHSRRCRSPQYLYRLLQLWRRNPQLVEQACAAAGEVARMVVDQLAGAGATTERREGP